MTFITWNIYIGTCLFVWKRDSLFTCVTTQHCNRQGPTNITHDSNLEAEVGQISKGRGLSVFLLLAVFADLVQIAIIIPKNDPKWQHRDDSRLISGSRKAEKKSLSTIRLVQYKAEYPLKSN